jgi:cell division protein FtsQ
MSIKGNIKKIVLLSLGTVMAAGLLVLLVAAIKHKSEKTCEGVLVNIRGGKEFSFLNRQEVLKIMVPGETPVFKGKAMNQVNLQKLEALLEAHIWIKDAELFFDNNAMLRVNIEEREAVARIFTKAGNSFYIDAEGKQLPLSNRALGQLPVFTGYPLEKIRTADSSLLRQIKELSLCILSDSFWNAQIAQVDITGQRTFELIPVVGNHIVQIGDGNNCNEKLHRLLLFYQQVSVKVGMDKYSVVNVQYPQQVIGTRRGTINKIDSIQAVKNIRQMIESARQLQIDSSVSTSVDNNIISVAPSDTTLTLLIDKQQHAAKKDSLSNRSNAANIFRPTKKQTVRN